jgi:hypothetical protein
MKKQSQDTLYVFMRFRSLIGTLDFEASRAQPQRGRYCYDQDTPGDALRAAGTIPAIPDHSNDRKPARRTATPVRHRRSRREDSSGLGVDASAFGLSSGDLGEVRRCRLNLNKRHSSGLLFELYHSDSSYMYIRVAGSIVGSSACFYISFQWNTGLWCGSTSTLRTFCASEGSEGAGVVKHSGR